MNSTPSAVALLTAWAIAVPSASSAQRGGGRQLLYGFALECSACTSTTAGVRRGAGAFAPSGGRAAGRGGEGRGAQWHYDEYPRVAAVADGGPAARAGIRVGDYLIAVDDLSLLSDEGAQQFSASRAGDQVTLTLERDGKLMDVTMPLGGGGGTGLAARLDSGAPLGSGGGGRAGRGAAGLGALGERGRGARARRGIDADMAPGAGAREGLPLGLRGGRAGLRGRRGGVGGYDSRDSTYYYSQQVGDAVLDMSSDAPITASTDATGALVVRVGPTVVRLKPASSPSASGRAPEPKKP